MLSVACDENLVLVSKDIDADEFYKRKTEAGVCSFFTRLVIIMSTSSPRHCCHANAGTAGCCQSIGEAMKTVMFSPPILSPARMSL